MVGAGTVVTQTLARESTQEDGARVAQQRLPFVGLAGADFQMFWRHAVADLAGFKHRARVDQSTSAFQGSADDIASRHLRQQTLDRRMHGGDVRSIRTQQDALRQLVVLGLAEEVHGDPVGGCGAIGNDQDFTRPGDHVDAHLTKHAPLGAGHIGVARASDFVNTRERGGAVGQRRHSLRAAHGEHAVHTRHMGGCQHQCIALALRCGHDHHDVFDTGHLRGDGVHQHA